MNKALFNTVVVEEDRGKVYFIFSTQSLIVFEIYVEYFLEFLIQIANPRSRTKVRTLGRSAIHF